VRGSITGADASGMTRAPKSWRGVQWRVNPDRIRAAPTQQFPAPEWPSAYAARARARAQSRTASWYRKWKARSQHPFLWPASVHLVQQPVEMCPTPRVDQAQLSIEIGRVRRQFGESLPHAGELVAVFRAVLRVEPHIAAVFDHLEAVAVPLGMQPMVALGRTGGWGGDEETDKGETHLQPLFGFDFGPPSRRAQ
jgi:hypothetical protein